MRQEYEYTFECEECGAVYKTVWQYYLPEACYECSERHPWERTSKRKLE